LNGPTPDGPVLIHQRIDLRLSGQAGEVQAGTVRCRDRAAGGERGGDGGLVNLGMHLFLTRRNLTLL
jgi:hypothetical protein